MRCAAGCSRCCVDGLTVTAIEAAVIAEHVARSPVAINRGGGCAALDAEGRCQIYEARPILCRSHGVPMVERLGSLPVVSSSCELNFTGPAALEAVGQDCHLDPETLGAKLWAIDAAWSDSRGEERNRRFSILEVLENS